MLQDKTYTGIVVDDETLKVARVQVEGNKLKLISLDKVRLVEPLITNRTESSQGEGDIFGNETDNESGDDEDIIFGLEMMLKEHPPKREIKVKMLILRV
ncbi:hypothetical protein [Gracilimonas sp.]|uniref:hypothetical protein n=1 Tax=Gracilimonas sp. TaxID=1974203 RepID=UPI0028712C77|nr:hypothetical protein [Gracilimonas sp.]